jgi:hypothetical protein
MSEMSKTNIFQKKEPQPQKISTQTTQLQHSRNPKYPVSNRNHKPERAQASSTKHETTQVHVNNTYFQTHHMSVQAPS